MSVRLLNARLNGVFDPDLDLSFVINLSHIRIHFVTFVTNRIGETIGDAVIYREPRTRYIPFDDAMQNKLQLKNCSLGIPSYTNMKQI